MRCPHCQIAIHPAATTTAFANEGAVEKEGRVVARQAVWSILYQRCPSCHQAIIFLQKLLPPIPGASGSSSTSLVYPNVIGRIPQIEVTEPYRQDFIEASSVLKISEKASAAISRRCLQMLLRDKAGVKPADLYNEIEEFIKSGKAPSDIEESLHAVRHIGNFAAHPIKSQNTGEIFEVEAGEAEWNLDVLERLFDYFFVGPAITKKRKDELNKKLIEAGKPPIP